MIILNNPVLEFESKHVILSCSYELEGKSDILWYKFPKHFSEYLITERMDGFVVGILFLGLKTGNDIKVNGSISSRLNYTLNHYLINALCLSNPEFKKMRVIADSLDDRDYNIGNCAGTGLSCGVDSFATYYDHLNEMKGYSIDYFTFFNVGSNGDFGGKKARQIFYDRLDAVKEFADEVGKEVISVDSNLSEVLKMNFLQTNTLRNLSCVLHLQKLFRNYYIASKNRFDYFKLHPWNNQDYDTLTLDLFSTEAINFYSAVSHLTRVERTALISNYEAPQRFLDVCTNPNHNKGKRNCSECDKCLRTALTLDLLDSLHNFRHVFDISCYFKNKDNYIGKILANRKADHFSEEIFDLLKEKKVLSSRYYYSQYRYQLRGGVQRFKKMIKTKLD